MHLHVYVQCCCLASLPQDQAVSAVFHQYHVCCMSKHLEMLLPLLEPEFALWFLVVLQLSAWQLLLLSFWQYA